MKTVAILCAMPEELTPLKSMLILKETISTSPWHIARYEPIDRCQIITMITGIGRAAAAAATATISTMVKPDLIINIGTAGGLNNTAIKSLVVSTEGAYADVDVTAFGYAMGQMAGQEKTFKSTVHNDIITAIKKEYPSMCEGLICTVDSFVANKDKVSTITAQYPEAVAIEMELAAIGQIANQHNIPFIAFKIISDTADGKIAATDFKANIADATTALAHNIHSILSIVSAH